MSSIENIDIETSNDKLDVESNNFSVISGVLEDNSNTPVLENGEDSIISEEQEIENEEQINNDTVQETLTIEETATTEETVQEEIVQPEIEYLEKIYYQNYFVGFFLILLIVIGGAKK